jgi:ankyrin repeat protein
MVLLDRGANVNATSTQVNTALHAAINRGVGVVRLLAERGADLHAQNKQVFTALDVASGRGGRGRRGGGGGGRGGQPRENIVALLKQLMGQ